jgi:hypothetical protein
MRLRHPHPPQARRRLQRLRQLRLPAHLPGSSLHPCQWTSMARRVRLMASTSMRQAAILSAWAPPWTPLTAMIRSPIPGRRWRVCRPRHLWLLLFIIRLPIRFMCSAAKMPQAAPIITSPGFTMSRPAHGPPAPICRTCVASWRQATTAPIVRSIWSAATTRGTLPAPSQIHGSMTLSPTPSPNAHRFLTQ